MEVTVARSIGFLTFLIALTFPCPPIAAQTNVHSGFRTRIAFGSTLALAGNQLLVARPGELTFFPAPANHAGSVHVFERDASGQWAERASVAAADGEVGDRFGHAFAASGDLLIIGAPGAANGAGEAYAFTREVGSWREVARLTSPNGSAGDAFGASVALAGDVALIGAPGRQNRTGSVTVFRRTASGWTADGTLDASGVAEGEDFGAAISFDGAHAIVGAPGAVPGMVATAPPGRGAVLLFSRTADGTWRRTARFTLPTGEIGSLGASVLMRDNEAFAAAPFAAQFVGAVLRYTRGEDGTWTEAGRVAAPGATPGGFFGASMADAGNELMVGALQEQGLGAVHVFRRAAGQADWQHAQRLAGDAQFGGFGAAIALGADDAFVGVPGADVFEGSTVHFRKDASSGEWRRTSVLITDPITLEPITGGARTCTDGKVDAFGCGEVDLVSFLPVSALGGERGNIVNDLWGWTDPQTGREIAVVGRNDGTVFIDLTDAANPVYLGELPMHAGSTANLWRDVKVYNDHAFIVADGAGAHGMQVFDLRQLRNARNPPATFAETAHYDRIHSAHNIVINEATGFAYVVGASSGGETCGGGLHMVDIRDPANPAFAGCFSDARTGLARTGYSHDAQCITYNGPDEQYRGREICFGSNESMLSISDVTDKAKPVPIAASGYPAAAYLHQGWVSDDHRYLFMNDELDELTGGAAKTRTLVWDITELDDPVLVKEHLGTTTASDHNLYVKGNYLYESNYVSGLRILDISDPRNPVEAGFFDTVPWGPDSPGFAGSWSNYPYFSSGNIVVTSMREGVFILKQRPPRPVS
jgi:choice-of-anchor B domain-containing protein